MKARISVNKLGEYIEATPTRRRRIVLDQKEPMTFITNRYSKAREAAIEYLSNGFDDEIIIKAIDDLENTTSKKANHENDIQNSILFLQYLLDYDISNQIDFKGLEITKYHGNNPKLNINNVNISVNPDLVISGTIRNKKIKGAIKLHIAKTNTLTRETAKNVATLIHQFTQDHLIEKDETADLRYCISLDAFANIVESAPKSFLMRRRNIKYACTEIDMWWKKV